MLTKRIPISSFCFSFLFSFFNLSQCSLNNADFYVNDWTSLYTNKMNSEQLQFTANFLHIIYANALVDTKIQSFHSTFSHLYQKARINLSDLSNPNDELEQLSKIAGKLAFLTKMRQIYTEMLNDCIEQCNEDKVDIIVAALGDLQTYASEMLYIWGQEHDQEFKDILKNSAKTMAECEQSIHFASGLHKGLSNGELPFIAQEKDKTLAIMNVVLQTTPAFMHTADTLMNILNGACDDAMKIICLGMNLYEQHYKAIYNLIAQESFDHQYATTLFHPYVSLLPDVDHVFEHMIETTKFVIKSNKME